MSDNPNKIEEYPVPSDPFEREAIGTLWVLIPKAGAGILLSVVLILVRFWLEFGELPAFAFGFAAFTAALQILLIVGLRFANRTEVHPDAEARGDWLDKLGAWWLVACFLGAFFGWLCGKFGEMTPEYRNAFIVAKIFFTIVLPIVTMLPNLRYVRRNAAYVQVPLLVFVTLFPILVGIGSVVDLAGLIKR